MRVWAPQSSYAAKRDGVWEAIQDEVANLASLAEWEAYKGSVPARLRDLPPAFHEPLSDLLTIRHEELVAVAKARSLDLAYARAMEKD